MRILVATDAWHPQVNGVVRTLTSVAASVAKLGAEVVFLTPEGFHTVPMPTYPGLRCALPSPRAIARWRGSALNRLAVRTHMTPSAVEQVLRSGASGTR